jgi:hypothetical protein
LNTIRKSCGACAPRATSGKVIMPPPLTDEPDLF